MGKLTSKGKHIVKEGNHPHTNIISKSAIVEKRRYKFRILEMHLKLRGQQFKTILYICRLLYQNLMGTATQKLQQIQTQKRKSNQNTTLKIVIKPQEKRTKEEGKKKDLQKQTQNNQENGNRNIHFDNYLKCKWVKCSNQKTQTG